MQDYQLACPVEDVSEGKMQLVEVDDRLVIIVQIDGKYHCIDDVCTHDGGPLSDGELQGCQISCPRHGAQFDVTTGEALTMPATQATGCHEVKVEDGNLYVKIKD